MSKLGTDNLTQALTLLGQRIELSEAARIELVVCGGSALLALGLVRRSTRDIDVLGRIDSDNGSIISANPLPAYLLQAAEDVRMALHLPENWINAGPTDQLKTGLPEGFASRLVRKDYGSRLTVFFASRYDQIYFKLYAACDQGPGKHVSDLQELKPMEEEMLAASKWVLQQDDSEGFRIVYLDMLKQLGYERIIGQL